MPTPYVISGKITDSKGDAVSSGMVFFETASGRANAITNSSGQYVFDLANIGYDAGETVSYDAEDAYNNEILSSTFTQSGGTKTLNITTVVRKDPINTYSAKGIQLVNIGGKVISRDNPLPVEIIRDHS